MNGRSYLPQRRSTPNYAFATYATRPPAPPASPSPTPTPAPAPAIPPKENAPGSDCILNLGFACVSRNGLRFAKRQRSARRAVRS